MQIHHNYNQNDNYNLNNDPSLQYDDTYDRHDTKVNDQRSNPYTKGRLNNISQSVSYLQKQNNRYESNQSGLGGSVQ